MAEPQKRQIAYKARISDILKGRYIKEEGWRPNYILTEEGLRLSRVNIIATIVNIQRDSPNNSVVADDGTGTILLRSFEDFLDLKGIGVGDIVNIIGRPREFGEEKYLLPEIIKRIEKSGWVELRNLELSKMEETVIPEKGVEDTKKEEVKAEGDGSEPEKPNSFQRIYSLIKELDSGEGADTGEVSRKSGLGNAEELIGELLKEGEIFEIKRGRLKILE